MPRLPFGGQAGAGGAPPAGAIYTLLDSHIATGVETSYVFTPASAITFDEAICLKIFGTILVDGALNLEGKINGLTSNYFQDGLRVTGGTVTGVAIAADPDWTIVSSVLLSGNNRAACFEWDINLPNPTFANDGMHGFSKAVNDNTAYENFGLFHNDNNIGEISSIGFETSANQWVTGTTFKTYQVSSV